MNAPICGKDFKTGQTFIKTVLAPAFKTRMLGVSGWSSTNILGNRDGEVLDDPQSFKTKEESKLGVLDIILQPELYPDLYKDLYHKVCINYYPPHINIVIPRIPSASINPIRSSCAMQIIFSCVPHIAVPGLCKNTWETSPWLVLSAE